MKKIIIAASLVLITMLLVSGCAGGAATPPPAERVFYVNAIEIKGGTSTDSLAVPETDHKTLGKAFGYKGGSWGI